MTWWRALQAARSGRAMILRRDQQQAFRLRPLAKCLTRGLGLVPSSMRSRSGAAAPRPCDRDGRRHGAGRLWLPPRAINRLIGVSEQVDLSGMDRMFRHGRPNGIKFRLISPARSAGFGSPLMVPLCWNSEPVLKIAAFARSQSARA
jgi:hypothetical protein